MGLDWPFASAPLLQLQGQGRFPALTRVRSAPRGTDAWLAKVLAAVDEADSGAEQQAWDLFTLAHRVG